MVYTTGYLEGLHVEPVTLFGHLLFDEDHLKEGRLLHTFRAKVIGFGATSSKSPCGTLVNFYLISS